MTFRRGIREHFRLLNLTGFISDHYYEKQQIFHDIFAELFFLF